MNTKILKILGNWSDVKNASRTTTNKEHTELEATNSFIKKILLSEHSVVRLVEVKWIWGNIKSWIATHFARSTWQCFISTQRDDRTNKDRDSLPQGTLVSFEGIANAQHLIDTARKRLCKASHAETRDYMIDLKMALYMEGEIELSNVLVPNCVYRCGCPEFQNCGYFKRLNSLNSQCSSIDIQERYDAFNEIFRSDFLMSVKTEEFMEVLKKTALDKTREGEV